ncbi:MAG: ABC-F family ATP-binding cassette domain-containing protein [Candidatus Doudnabacteria bacterium]|nr:ABC-F family ATP-binding cassette domain-containing protein [Candidatus Doudnabacteria bacterium]
MITANKIRIKYRQLLFDDLSFKLTNHDKVGLLGLNGTGKSTLLKIIVGDEQPDSGKIDIGNERIAYLPQEFELPDQLVGEFLETLVTDPHNEMYKVTKILHKLGLDDIDIYQEIKTLSYGQQMKLYLTKLLIDNPTVLLLDEPTNYLDLPGILWVEQFIQKFEGACIIISHDRAFLNNVINKVFEIDEQRLYEFPGNYDKYLEYKAKFVEKRAIEYEMQERRRKKLEERIVLIQKFSSGKKQAAQLQNARHRLEREVTSVERDAYKEQKIKGLNLKGEVPLSKQILKIEDLAFKYDNGREILKDADLEVFGREKIWFFGANGIGKSTLIKLIVGEYYPHKGEVKIGDNLRWGYFSQNQSHLNPDEQLQEYFMRATNISFSQSFGILSKFLFPKELVQMKIGSLSPGQRARLSFAVFAQQELDFLILDEPTNHLDIRSKEIIEEAFRNYQGAMLLISHDRYFVESIGMDRTITISEGQVVEV